MGRGLMQLTWTKISTRNEVMTSITIDNCRLKVGYDCQRNTWSCGKQETNGILYSTIKNAT